MVTKLILTGIIFLPFFVWPGMDTREPKYLLATGISLLLGLWGLKSGIRPYKNIWLLAFLAYLPINFLLSPHIDLLVSGVPMPSWVLQAFFYILVFFLAHVATSNARVDILRILDTMIWVGAVSAVYALLQYFGFEQFFVGGDGHVMCGAMGNPAVLAAFLAMIVPIALHRRKYLIAIGLLLTVFFINSQVASGALIVSLMFLFGTKNPPARLLMRGMGVILAVILIAGYFMSPKIHKYVDDNGRFEVWKQIVKDIQTPLTSGKAPHSFTGFGLGSFRYMFHAQHPKMGLSETFLEAHSEYFELLYNTGIVGLGLFLLAVGWFIWSCFPLDRLNAHLLASFICIAVCAGGLFVWQNGAIIFYTIVITGILTGRERS